jgi:homocitrate synthase NifV
MIKIIDSTLSVLDDACIEKEQMIYFIKLLGEIGIKDIQLSIQAYLTLEGKLPEGFRYYLLVDTASFVNQEYPKGDAQIERYFTPKKKINEKDIVTYHINNLEEPERLHHTEKDEYVKVIGLDQMLLQGCKEGMDALRKKFSFRNLILEPENTFSCATAIALMFLQNKGYAVVTSMKGIGNKAATEQVLMALHVMERYMVSKSFQVFIEIRKWMETNAKQSTSPIAPVFGEKIFCVESGIHVDGILKKPTNYEPYPPEEVGLSREIVLGKHSGKNSVLYKIDSLRPGSERVKEHAEEILEEVKSISKQIGQAITDREFLRIIERFDEK